MLKAKEKEDGRYPEGCDKKYKYKSQEIPSEGGVLHYKVAYYNQHSYLLDNVSILQESSKTVML